MQTKLARRLASAAVLTLAVATAGAASAETTAVVGATIIDGNGGAPIRDGVVVFTDKRITAVGARGAVAIPAGAKTINAAGKYVTPGLMDANVHLVPWPSWTYIEFLARYENSFDLVAEEAAQLALKHGFTTVFDSMGPADALILARDRINRGEREGARMFIAGDIVGFRAVFTEVEAMKSASKAFQARINARFELNGGPDLTSKSPTQVYEEMRKYAAKVDFVKYGATGDGAQVNSEIGQGNILRFTPEQQKALVKAVHDEGKIVQTHQGSAEAMHIAVEVGNDMAQHCAHTGNSRMYDATIKLMLEKKFYCGTQWGLLNEDEQRQVRENNFKFTDKDNGQPRVNFGVENGVRMIKAGVPQLVSTDAGTIDPDVLKDFGADGPPGGLGGRNRQIGEAEFINMKAMSQRGMTPMMIIQAATKNIAMAYHKQNDIGTLEPGKYADLIVVDADPLADIENLSKVSMVIKEGKVIDTAALPRNPVLTSPQATNPGAIRTR